MRKPSPAEPVPTRAFRAPETRSEQEIGVHPSRQAQSREALLQHDESIVTNARILTLNGVEDQREFTAQEASEATIGSGILSSGADNLSHLRGVVGA